VHRKVIEVAGHLYVEAPKNRKRRQTVYPHTAPSGYPLAKRLATRMEQARTEQDSGTNPLGLIFPSLWYLCSPAPPPRPGGSAAVRGAGRSSARR